MQAQLTVTTRDDGRPQVFVPPDRLWEIAQYLADRRVNATYTLDHQGFLIFFSRLNPRDVQSLLDARRRWTGPAEKGESFAPPVSRRKQFAAPQHLN